MIKKEMIAMLLAGGQGSRLGVLTSKVAKPAVAFGGKYRIIDFPLSNCINSGVDTVGVLTQYQPLRLNTHIGIGIPWDLDRNEGGVTVLPPYEKVGKSEWYTGTANAIYQNLTYMETFHPDYVLILSGDHIYKMDYEVMLNFHKAHNADVSIAVMPVPESEAGRFGIVVTDEDGRILEFQEKPEHPKSNLASMGIYIFTWKALKDALLALSRQSGCDFGKHVIPYCHDKGETLVAYEFNGYWKDVGTLGSYWEANMELIDIIPEFNLYEEFWKIYTKNDILPPQYASENSVIERCLVGDGSEIYGKVYNSIIGCGVVIEEGAEVRDSIVMQNTVIGAGSDIYRAVIAENVTVGANVKMGVGEEAPNREKPSVYAFGLVVVGENSVIPPDVSIGKNTAIAGVTAAEHYPGGWLAAGETLDLEAISAGGPDETLSDNSEDDSDGSCSGGDIPDGAENGAENSNERKAGGAL
ncbi:MAG: glucose-1-phosphate adenylyltransferase [Lachnospiraceae bacterium]|nr:glucose-1-phosphate adenylyltransferase [Lachnospiraceae bacterium]